MKMLATESSLSLNHLRLVRDETQSKISKALQSWFELMLISIWFNAPSGVRSKAVNLTNKKKENEQQQQMMSLLNSAFGFFHSTKNSIYVSY